MNIKEKTDVKSFYVLKFPSHEGNFEKHYFQLSLALILESMNQTLSFNVLMTLRKLLKILRALEVSLVSG